MNSNTKRLLPLLLLGAALLLLILYFAAVRPLTREPEDTTVPPVVTGEGEGELYNKGTLYPPIPREEMLSITVHNEKGTYRFARVGEEDAAPTVRDNFALFLEEEGVFVEYGHIPYDEERFSELVVATGTFYYLKNLSEEPETQGQPLDFADYGLSDLSALPWFEITPLEGEPVRVYIGDKAVTDNGYYVRVAGRDTVYVSHTASVGSTALSEAATFVSKNLGSALSPYSYYYMKDFTLWRPMTAAYTVTAEDTVTYRYREVIDGVVSSPMEAATDMNRAVTELRTAFCDGGKRLGSGGFSFTITYPNEEKYEEKYRGKTVEFRVEEILRVDKLFLRLNYLNESERDSFHAGCAYTISAPASKKGYTPNSSHYMTVLETLGQLKCLEVVAIGLERHPELISEYGLDAYTLYYENPLVVESIPGSNDVKAEQYLPNYLYISEKQADGTYFVGSVLADVVARVDGSLLSFLERKESFWLEETMFAVKINEVTKLEFDFSYSDRVASYAFAISQKADDGGKLSVNGVTYLGDGRALNVDYFKNFYMHLVTIYYSGDYDGEGPIQEVMAGESVLTMRVTVRGDRQFVYRFYPYSSRHVLVTVSEQGGSEGGLFYILAPEVEKIYRDIEVLLSGGCPDPEGQY